MMADRTRIPSGVLTVLWLDKVDVAALEWLAARDRVSVPDLIRQVHHPLGLGADPTVVT
jgi:hypothetical protein